MAINFPNSPAINDIFTSGGQSWKWDGTKWVPLSGSPSVTGSGKNILRRNGGFEVWQRGAGGSAVFNIPASAAPTYTADGWHIATGANQACQVLQVGPLEWAGSTYAAKIARVAGQTGTALLRFGYSLDTDELYPVLGQYVVLSFVAQAAPGFSNAGLSLGVQFTVGTGSPAKIYTFVGITSPINSGVILSTAAPARYQLTSTVPIPINTRQAEVTFYWTPVGTAGDDGFYLDDVQLEVVPAATGYVASKFERLNFQEQLLLCQRHFQKTFPYTIAPASAVGSGTGEAMNGVYVAAAAVRSVSINHILQVPLRHSAPTLQKFNPSIAGNEAHDLTANAVCSATNLVPSHGTIMVTATGAASGQVGDRAAVHLTADAGI